MSSSNLGPFLPLYVDDFIGGTIHMGADEVGAYLLLLAYQWSGGLIEDDPIVIERVSRCSYERLGRVLRKFESKDGFLFNRRLEAIRRERVAYVKSRSKNASKGWEKRKSSSGEEQDAHAEHTVVHTERNPSPSPSPSISPSSNAKAREAAAAKNDEKSDSRIAECVKRFKDVRPEFARLRDVDIENALKSAHPDYWDQAISEFEANWAGALELPRLPYKLLAAYLSKIASGAGGGKKQKGRLS